MIFSVPRVCEHPGHRVGHHRRYRVRRPHLPHHLEDLHNHPRPARVRQVREGDTERQVGHGMLVFVCLLTLLVIFENHVLLRLIF